MQQLKSLIIKVWVRIESHWFYPKHHWPLFRWRRRNFNRGVDPSTYRG